MVAGGRYDSIETLIISEMVSSNKNSDLSGVVCLFIRETETFLETDVEDMSFICCWWIFTVTSPSQTATA